jgi:hypothetical protein
MKKRLLVSMIPAVACLALAAPALAATQEGSSENWAGYVVNSNDGSGFSAVSGQWKTPSVDCTANAQPSYSAYWVGLGGGGEQSSALEQIGTQADCDASGNATYYAWYELVPSAPVKLSLAIQPGDSIWARTAVDGDQVSLYITDRTTHQTWNKTLTMTSATPDTSTAEWVAEAPSECSSGTTDCTPLPLANFGKATFTDAYTTSNGHVGSISDSNWTAEAIQLEPSSSSLYGGGPGGYLDGGYSGYSTSSSYDTTAGSAAPSSLSDGGTKFTVQYGGALQTSSSSTGQGQSDPYGYDSGSGNGYGGGYAYNDGGYGGYGSYGYGGDGYSGGYSDGYSYGWDDGWDSGWGY